MKRVAFLLIVFIISCNGKQKNQELKDLETNKLFTLKGTIKGNYNDYIYLGYGQHKDSTKVVNGTFEFKNTLDLPTQQGWLHLKPPSYTDWVYLEGSNITVEAEYQSTIQNKETFNRILINKITGSTAENVCKEYRDFYQANKLKENFGELLHSKLTSMIKQNPQNSFFGKACNDLMSRSELTIPQIETLFSLLDTTCQTKYDIKYYKIKLEKRKKYNVGKELYNFSLPDTNGNLVNLSDFKGKYVLVDFWASWCSPCRYKHKQLVKFNDQFKGDEFQLISLSKDENEEHWKKAIKHDSLSWVNVIDKGEKVSDELAVYGIPFNYLVSPEGKIIAINQSLEIISEILKKEIP